MHSSLQNIEPNRAGFLHTIQDNTDGDTFVMFDDDDDDAAAVVTTAELELGTGDFTALAIESVLVDATILAGVLRTVSLFFVF